MEQITDPELLGQLESQEGPKGLRAVTDPELLSQLEGPTQAKPGNQEDLLAASPGSPMLPGPPAPGIWQDFIKPTLKEAAKTIPYAAVSGLQSFIGPPIEAIRQALASEKPNDINQILDEAVKYWEPKTVKIPNYTLTTTPEGGLLPQFQRVHDVPISKIIGETAGAAGFVAGPASAATKGGIEISQAVISPAIQKFLLKTPTPYVEKILGNMIGGSMLGQGDPTETAQNAVLFGLFEAIPGLPQAIKDSNAWREARIPERGLMLQSLADTIRKNPEMSEGEILRNWPNLQKEALARRAQGEVGGVAPQPGETTFRTPTVPDEISTPPVEQFRPFETSIPPKIIEQPGPFYPLTTQGPPPGPPPPAGMGLTVETGPPPPALSTTAGETPTTSPVIPSIQGMQPITSPDLINQLNGERRVNTALRQRVDQMTPEEMKQALLTDPLTGLPNKRAFEESTPGTFQGMADVDNLKWINDNFGHQAGDELLKTVGKALADQVGQDNTFAAFHISGDEFVVQGNDPAQIEARLAKATEALKNVSLKYTAPDGTIHELKGIGLSYGKGADLATAEKGLQENKAAREISGERAGRGQKPARVVQVPAQGREIGGKAKQPPEILTEYPILKSKVPETSFVKRQKGHLGLTKPQTFYHVSSTPIEKWKPGEVSLSDRPMKADFGDHVYKANVDIKRPAPSLEAYNIDRAQKTGKYDGLITDSTDYQGKPIKLVKVKDSSQLKNIEYKNEGPGRTEIKAKDNQVYRARGVEDAQKMRQQEPEGSLAYYDDQSKKEWLRGQNPPKNGKLTLYRATSSGAGIKPGDYVTNSLQYAKDHIKNNLGGKGKVAKIEATLDDIYPADGPGEFWYAPKKTPDKAVSPEFAEVEVPKNDTTYLHSGLSPHEALKNLREHIPITREHEILFERLYSNPWYMAKKHSKGKPTVDVQLRRDENRRQFYVWILRKAEPFFNLKGRNLDDLEKKLIEWDAKGIDHSGDINEMKKAGLNPQQIEAYKAVRKVLDQINADFKTTLIDAQLVKYRNEPFYQDLKKYAHDKTEPPQNVADNSDFQKALKALDKPVAEINKLRNEMGKVKGYFPRIREPGNYAVSARGVDGNLVSYEQTKTIAEAKKLVEKHKKEGLVSTYNEITKTPESVFQGIDAISLDRFLSQAIDKIKSGSGEKATLADELQKAVLEAMVENLKARGWTKHGIQRTRGEVIKGYKETDLKSVLNQYLAGYAGWKTKYIASYEFTEELAKLHKSDPQIFEYFSKYAKDALRNSETIDQLTGKVRGIAFTYYLMGNLKQVFLQLTQGLTTVLPQARKIKTFPEKDLLKAQIDVVTRGGMTPEETKMMQVAKDKSIIDDPYVQEVTARMEGGMRPAMRKAAQILNLPISGMEKFNRAYTMLASYRWFREKGQGTAEAFKSARDFVQDVHWLYGQANLPEPARGESPVARSVGRTAYTFIPWAHNYLLSLKEGWQRGGTKGRIASLESLAWMALLAGPLAIPFLDDLTDLAEKLTGRPLRKNAIDFLKDKTGSMSSFFTHGLAGLMGTDISGSMKIGLPGYSLLSGQEDVGENLFGVFTNIGKGLGHGAVLMSDKDFSRALEEMSPTFLKNPQTAIREYNQGRTTWKGKPIFDFSGEKPKQDKITLREAISKASGFNPQRRGEQNLKYESYSNMIKMARDKQNNLVDRFVKYQLDQNSAGKDKVIEELRAFNTEMKDKGMPEFQIIGSEFKSRVRMRLQPGKKATLFYGD